MYSEEIKYAIPYLEDGSHLNKIRNSYFENRNFLTNVLDFLDQEVVIMPSSYFYYLGGCRHIMEDDYIYVDINENEDIYEFACDWLGRIDCYDGYHLSILDNYITIVDENRRCIFTNKDMEEGKIIGTIVWVKNYNEILKKYKDRNLKRISKAIVCPLVNKIDYWNREIKCLDEEFCFFMDIYCPEVAFKYTFDTYMTNVCIDVYNKLVKRGLNGLVDKYIPSYKQCDGYGEKGKEVGYSSELCKCGGLIAFCYIDV
ncbi:hypothetical protein CONCODRAFT_76885 [Conidiobolus coronatus NRRL 28638]|uniref:Uncharacterized protein n=1 Tax=Conidiobolus coronatus (strain ATCC 28846 / CBS 209.66 / NRRL 28638) TaxID=796925 RepID=A0A137PHF1_CONC2|nr:hypothetical protein CONCODRAFT_76885 [Conidiobolus coronatus NRRL 28638]|eukprot:KXN74361.1 hypothetical protein CONCODRAFT_76885 [Conidiobolus coronatus NRRL 28638]